MSGVVGAGGLRTAVSREVKAAQAAEQDDEERQRWLHLKDQSVRSALLIKGALV